MQPQKKSNNTLGMLGTIASIGGAAFGVPWLGALGAGMQGLNTMKNGDSSMQTATATGGAMNEILNCLKDGWMNPAKTDAKAIKDKVQEMTDTELANKWQVPPYGHNYTDKDGNIWIWDKNGGCFGTGGYRAPNFYEDTRFWTNLAIGLGGL